MAYTVLKLITNAYYITGIVSRELETVSGSQFEDGLDSLNDIIMEKTSEKGMIPYFTTFDFDSIIGVEEYYIENLIEVSTLVFFLSSVRYQMIPIDRDAYFGLPRAENVESLPFNYHVEREFGGARIFLYFKPQQAYPMKLWGKFRLAEVSLNQDLSLTLDRFYISYLKYKLAERICIDFQYTVPPDVIRQLEELEMTISKRSGPLDLKMKKISTLNNVAYGLNYAQANLGKGWSVP